MKSIIEKTSEIMAIVGTELTHGSYERLSHAIIEALEEAEESTRSKCAELVLECKNNLDCNNKPGFVNAQECIDIIMQSRDSNIGECA